MRSPMAVSQTRVVGGYVRNLLAFKQSSRGGDPHNVLHRATLNLPTRLSRLGDNIAADRA